MKKLLIAMALMACTDDESTVRTLKAHGFTDIKTTGHAFMDCSERDTFATSFTAKNSQGVAVSGAVCCGFFKNCTVRF